MSSTQITVENQTDIPIYALLTWAGGHVGGVVINAAEKPPTRPGAEGTGAHRESYSSAQVGCEYVYYDFAILDDREGKTRDVTGVVGGTTLAKKQARGSTSWIFKRTEQGYQLVER
jgi:hypothetical protein